MKHDVEKLPTRIIKHVSAGRSLSFASVREEERHEPRVLSAPLRLSAESEALVPLNGRMGQLLVAAAPRDAPDHLARYSNIFTDTV